MFCLIVNCTESRCSLRDIQALYLVIKGYCLCKRAFSGSGRDSWFLLHERWFDRLIRYSNVICVNYNFYFSLFLCVWEIKIELHICCQNLGILLCIIRVCVTIRYLYVIFTCMYVLLQCFLIIGKRIVWGMLIRFQLKLIHCLGKYVTMNQRNCLNYLSTHRRIATPFSSIDLIWEVVTRFRLTGYLERCSYSIFFPFYGNWIFRNKSKNEGPAYERAK